MSSEQETCPKCGGTGWVECFDPWGTKIYCPMCGEKEGAIPADA